MSEQERINVLFVCSRNQWRSPTGERIWRKHPVVDARSAGTSKSARKTVTAKDILWADVIIAMEPTHKQRLQASYRRETANTSIFVLDIPDEYQCMDPDLVAMLGEPVAALLGVEW